jgi:hypothetical protein
MTAEQWVPVTGFPAYHISSRGRVASTKWGAPRLVKPTESADGYQQVTLYRDRLRHTHRVHVLVATAFLGRCPVEGYEVRHLNGRKADNRAENLRWGSRSENIHDTVRHGTHNFARRTHCAQGHPFNAMNTRQLGDRRLCRICRRETNRRYRDRRALRAAGITAA